MKKTIVKITMLVMLLSLLTSCTRSTNPDRKEKDDILYNNAYEDIDPSTLLVATSYAEIGYNPNDSNIIYERSTAVAIATVTSIDGGSNVDEFTNDYVYPYTYGKLQIETVIKGDITEGEEINYVRMGGIVPYEAYFNSLYPEQQQKHTAQQVSRPAYVKMTFDEDIDIEVGKSYLVYMENTAGYVSRKDSYAIIGWQGGLKEARSTEGDSRLRSASVNTVEVYNNYSNTWECLNSVIPE